VLNKSSTCLQKREKEGEKDPKSMGEKSPARSPIGINQQWRGEEEHQILTWEVKKEKRGKVDKLKERVYARFSAKQGLSGKGKTQHNQTNDKSRDTSCLAEHRHRGVDIAETAIHQARPRVG